MKDETTFLSDQRLGITRGADEIKVPLASNPRPIELAVPLLLKKYKSEITKLEAKKISNETKIKDFQSRLIAVGSIIDRMKISQYDDVREYVQELLDIVGIIDELKKSQFGEIDSSESEKLETLEDYKNKIKKLEAECDFNKLRITKFKELFIAIIDVISEMSQSENYVNRGFSQLLKEAIGAIDD